MMDMLSIILIVAALGIARWASDLLVEYNFAGNELALLAGFVVPCQLLGFFTGTQKGLNPDCPKNLTRVVMLD